MCGRRVNAILIVSLLELLLVSIVCGVQDDSDFKSDWGQISQLSKRDPNATVVQFLWSVDNFWDILSGDDSDETIVSPRFYLTTPGYRLQLMLIPNTTYSDRTSYTGLFFRLVTGVYDQLLDWPYRLKTTIRLLPENYTDITAEETDSAGDPSFTIVPNTDPCRLRSAFLRPSADNDNNPRPDGCGNRRHVSLNFLADNRELYVSNDTLRVRLTVNLGDHGDDYPRASMEMKYNQLVSNYEWSIRDYPKIQNDSLTADSIAVLTSDQFYTHSKGYLVQMFVTLLPKRKAFALSMALVQGDNDRYLQWPFPYTFEVAIVDQSPGYWRRDYSVTINPPTSQCGTEPFGQPSGFPDFCFIAVQSMELLSLPHYNFLANGTLRIRFTTSFERYSMRERASLAMSTANANAGRLMAEYNWLIPAIDGKLERYTQSENGEPKILTSQQFYTNGQGYLLQLILTMNGSAADNASAMGLELAIVEGEYDAVIDWPFNNTFELSIVKQTRGDDSFAPTSDALNDLTVKVVPALSEHCGRASFQRPIERNQPCGAPNLVSFDRISRSRDYIKTGSLRVRARIYL